MTATVTPIQSPKKRRYDGASTSNRTSQWRAPSTDATSAINNPATLRNRARDLSRNNAWAAKALSVITNNVVGYGVRAQWRGKNKSQVKKIQQSWCLWAESTQCDSTGMSNFYGLQQLAMRTVVESGECLVRLRPRLPSDGLEVPMQIQVMECDYLYEMLDGQTRNGNIISRGIEYDGLGRRVAYYLYKHHPGAVGLALRTDWNAYTRVPASEIIHVMRRDRPDQERGVSWLAPVMITLRELDIYEDAYLKRQQIANLFAAFVHTEDGIDETEEEYSSLEEGLQPGSLYLMRPNRSMEFNTPPKADDYGPYTRDNLKRVAAGMGITYESLSGDLSDVNFSSARMGWQEFGRNVDSWRWNLFIPSFCDGVASWFMQLSGITTAKPFWTAPSRTMVDPTREVPAVKDAIRAGLMTQSEAIRQQGYDAERLFEEMAADNAAMDKLGLVLDSDPRQTLKQQQEKLL